MEFKLVDRIPMNPSWSWAAVVLFLGLLVPCMPANCNAGYKVFVYELPAAVTAAAENARKTGEYHSCKKCIYEQFALEYIIYDYFTHHCSRTLDASEADYFYLPIIREIDYRIALNSGGKRAPSVIEEALLDAIEKGTFAKWMSVFNVTSEHWQRNNGSDHIIVMPAPVTNFRHQTNMRGFFHYMMQLNPPIFINVEYSQSFVQEYPICSRHKNIVAPYPTVDPDFYSGKLFMPGFPNIKRDKLIFYLGGNHGSCVFVREALTALSRDKSIAIQRGPRKREEGFQSAIFCPIPIGDSPSSKRMYDVLNFGCIPVVLSDELVWAYSEATGGPLQPWQFSIQLPQSVVQKSAAHVLAKQQAAAASDSKRSGTAVGAAGQGRGQPPPHSLMNGGHPLPSGATVLSILEEIAEEDRQVEAQRMTNGTVRSAGRRRLQMELSAEEQRLLEDSHRYLLQGSSSNGAGAGAEVKKKEKSHVTAAAVNTLIRVLHKISAEDIAALQAGVRNASTHYQYYAMDANMRTDVTPIGVHRYPDGGAVHMLDRLLTDRKMRGIQATSKLCQEERNRKDHKYVGNYPCEK